MKFFILLFILAVGAAGKLRAQESTFPPFPSQQVTVGKTVIFTKADGSQFVSYNGSLLWHPMAGTTSPNPTPPELRKQGAGGRRILFTRSNGERFSSYDGTLWRRESIPSVQSSHSMQPAQSDIESDNTGRARVLEFIPNPPRGQVTVRYYLPSEEKVVLSLMSGNGEEMLRIVDAHQAAGIHSAEFNTSGLKPSVYFYHLTVGRVISSGTVPIVH